MANNLSFGVAVNLLTENFKRGQAEIQNGFREIKSTALQMAGVFGLGLGFTQLIEKMIDVAKESAAVNKALKVASGGWAEYGENQKYIINLSNKLGLSVNEMTGAFAKFTASAKTSNIDLKDQQQLFTGLNSALLAVGAKPEAKAEALDAISKMMQKGTITAKMLVGGLGSALPESLSIMAKSLGVTTDKLRDMAKHGQLIASDVMPKFGAELEKAFKNVDTDTIGGALNRVGNDFEELTKKLSVGDIYKNTVKSFEEGFKWVLDNFKMVGDGIVNIVSTVIIGKAFGAFKQGLADITAKAETEFIKQAIAAEKLAVQQELINTTLTKSAQKRYLSESIAAAENTAKQEFAAVSTKLVWVSTWNSIKVAALAVWSAIAPMLIISGLIAVGQYLYGLVQKSNELKNEFKDFIKASEKLSYGGSSTEITKMQELLRITNDKKKSHNEINSAQKELMNMLGLEKASQEQLTAEVTKRSKIALASANADYFASAISTATNTKHELASNIGIPEATIDKLAKIRVELPANWWELGAKMLFGGFSREQKEYYQILSGTLNKFGSKSSILEAEQAVKGVRNQNQKIEYSQGMFDTAQKDITNSKITDLENKPKKVKEDTVEKYEDEVSKKLIEYKNQLDNKVITTREYNKLYDNLNVETAKKLGGLLTADQAKKDQVYLDAKAGIAKPLSSVDDKVEAAKEDYIKKLTEQDGLLKNKIISPDEYTNAVASLVDEFLRTASAIKGIDFASNAFVKALLEKKKELDKTDKNFVLPTNAPIDKTFDYKKTDVERQEDKAQQNDDYIKAIEKEFSDKGVKNIKQQMADAGSDLTALKSQFNGQADQLIDELNKALKNAPDLSKALKIMQVKKDVKDLQHQLNTGLYSGVKEVANSAKNLYESFDAIKKTFSNVNASGWQKILAVWDGLTNGLDSILSVIKMVEELSAIIKALGAAKQAEAAIGATTSGVQIAANVAETASYTALMAAETAAAYAFIPFVGEGLAIAQIGVMQGAILAAAIPKFANGGIVQGSSFTGDKVLAGLNSGEMILNGGQQSTLFGLLNGQGGINNQPQTIVLETKLNGKDIYLSQKNYSDIKSKVK